MTSEEVLDLHISKMLNRLPDSYNELSEMKKLPEYKITLEAMNYYGKQQYNQAINDAAENASTRTNHESTSVIVDKESILKLKKI